MRAVQLNAYGNPAETITLVDLPEPAAAGPGEVLIGVDYAPVNPADLLLVMGWYAVRPNLPSMIGNEGVGTIIAVGPGVTNVAPGEATSFDEDEDKPDDTTEVKFQKARLRETKKALKESEKKAQNLAATLTGLQTSLNALAQGLGELSQDQKDTASDLRKLQMQLLDKAEAYEKERRLQNAAMVKITILLKGKRTEEETIKLTIQSLNISISALKRTKKLSRRSHFSSNHSLTSSTPYQMRRCFNLNCSKTPSPKANLARMRSRGSFSLPMCSLSGSAASGRQPRRFQTSSTKASPTAGQH